MAATIQFHIRFEGEFYNDYGVNFERLVYDPNQITSYDSITSIIGMVNSNVDTIDLDNFDSSALY